MNTPFDCTHPTDMFSGAQRRLFVIAALIEAAEVCGDQQFRDCLEEAVALIGEVRAQVKSLIDEIELATEFLDLPAQAEAA